MSGRSKFFISVFLAVTSLSVAVPQQAVVADSVLPPLKVVQLGDSYSAGNGARNSSGGRNYYGVNGCYRSSTNWGEQYVATLKSSFAVTYINRACSGGVISNITEAREIEKFGTSEFDPCPSAKYPDEEYWKRTEGNPDSCRRFLKPQIEVIDESVDLVLMTVGGNDIKFATIVQQCFAIGYRDPGDCREAVNFANTELDKVQRDLVDTFDALRARMRPDAKVVLVSYPQLVPDVDYRLKSLLRTDEYNAGDEIRKLGELGDEKQAAAVKTANSNAGREFVIHVEGVKELFDGHLPNPDQSSGRNPDRWLHEFETRIMAEWYHFNPLGHANLAKFLSESGSFKSGGLGFEVGNDVDIAFVVDTTGSMWDEIADVQGHLSDLVDQLSSQTKSHRVAVVSYRDFPQRTGQPGDYPFRVDQGFTNDQTRIQAAIDSLEADGGGDDPETVFSGINAALQLDWRPGVVKVILVIGDAPALSPEPISGLTIDTIIQRSLALDPAQIVGADVYGLNDNGAMSQIADGTGGKVVDGSANVVDSISEIFSGSATQPYAWLGAGYTSKPGVPITFDASGSYDPSGTSLTRFEWDFDGDGTYDKVTTVPTASHTYPGDFDGLAVVKVTGKGGTALASAPVLVNPAGSTPQDTSKPCPRDEFGRSILVDENGQWTNCVADKLPTKDLDGISVTSVDPNDGFRAVAPKRLIDTRSDDGLVNIRGKLTPGSVTKIDTKKLGIYADGDAPNAVHINITATQGDAAGYVTAYPCGKIPGTSTVNTSAPNQDIANTATIPLNSKGELCFTTSINTHLVVDITGYETTKANTKPSQFRSLAPKRIADTRSPAGLFKLVGNLTPGSVTKINTADLGIYQEGDKATAAHLTITATQPDRSGYVTAYPCGKVPDTSTVNTSFAGQDVANTATIPLNDAGEVCFTTSMNTHLVVDITGYYVDNATAAPTHFVTQQPTRSVDTRDGSGSIPIKGKLTPGSVTKLKFDQAERGTLSAVHINITATQGDRAGYITAYPCGKVPGTSTVNTSFVNQDIANTATIPVDSNGEVCVTTSMNTHLVVDVTGYYFTT